MGARASGLRVAHESASSWLVVARLVCLSVVVLLPCKLVSGRFSKAFVERRREFIFKPTTAESPEIARECAQPIAAGTSRFARRDRRRRRRRRRRGAQSGAAQCTCTATRQQQRQRQQQHRSRTICPEQIVFHAGEWKQSRAAAINKHSAAQSAGSARRPPPPSPSHKTPAPSSGAHSSGSWQPSATSVNGRPT